jgi:hypothetical protein
MLGSRFAASWALVKASWGVLRSDKQLAIFPIISALLTILVTITFIVPMALAGFIDQLLGGNQSVRPAGVAVAFAFYFVQYVVIFFANSALVGAALLKLEGRQATVGDGFRIAFSHLGPIFGYALISATVGMLLRWLRDQGRNNALGIVTAIAAGLLGAAWNIATYLAVPVLVVEGVGPIEAIKRSTGYLKRTWGEQLIGNLGIGLVFGLLTVLTVMVGVGLVVLAAMTGFIWAIVAAVAVGVSAVLVIVLISATLSGIYRAAVYRYATTGQVAPDFNPALVQGAFRQRAVSRSRFGTWGSGGF